MSNDNHNQIENTKLPVVPERRIIWSTAITPIKPHKSLSSTVPQLSPKASYLFGDQPPTPGRDINWDDMNAKTPKKLLPSINRKPIYSPAPVDSAYLINGLPATPGRNIDWSFYSLPPTPGKSIDWDKLSKSQPSTPPAREIGSNLMTSDVEMAEIRLPQTPGRNMDWLEIPTNENKLPPTPGENMDWSSISNNENKLPPTPGENIDWSNIARSEKNLSPTPAQTRDSSKIPKNKYKVVMNLALTQY